MRKTNPVFRPGEVQFQWAIREREIYRREVRSPRFLHISRARTTVDYVFIRLSAFIKILDIEVTTYSRLTPLNYMFTIFMR